MWYGCTLQEMSILSILGLIAISMVCVVIPSLLGLPTWIGIIIGGDAIKPVVKRPSCGWGLEERQNPRVFDDRAVYSFG